MSTRRQQCRECSPVLVDEGVSLSVGERCDERRGEAGRREDDAVVGRGEGVMWEAHRPRHVFLHVLFSRRTAAPLHSRSAPLHAPSASSWRRELHEIATSVEATEGVGSGRAVTSSSIAGFFMFEPSAYLPRRTNRHQSARVVHFGARGDGDERLARAPARG